MRIAHALLHIIWSCPGWHEVCSHKLDSHQNNSDKVVHLCTGLTREVGEDAVLLFGYSQLFHPVIYRHWISAKSPLNLCMRLSTTDWHSVPFAFSCLGRLPVLSHKDVWPWAPHAIDNWSPGQWPLSILGPFCLCAISLTASPECTDPPHCTSPYAVWDAYSAYRSVPLVGHNGI